MKTVFVVVTIMASCFTGVSFSQEAARTSVKYATDSDIAYRSGNGQTEYMRERCRLDVYRPVDVDSFSTVVWFHGGGLKNGQKSIPQGLQEKGIAVVAVNYRLTPMVPAADCIDDAAAAVAWTFKNIENMGGSSKKIFISGHSAGGYLTSMLGLDKHWLEKYDVDADRVAGLIPFSGHTITHFAIRDERGIANTRAVVDELAPLFHVRKDAPPTLLITGDRDMEMLGRYEENAYFWRMMKEVGHPNCELYELEGFNHGQMAEPAHLLLLKFVTANSK